MMNLDAASDIELLKFSFVHANGAGHKDLGVTKETGNVLARYAAARWLARTYRREGDVQVAARLEALGDALYMRIPHEARWSS